MILRFIEKKRAADPGHFWFDVRSFAVALSIAFGFTLAGLPIGGTTQEYVSWLAHLPGCLTTPAAIVWFSASCALPKGWKLKCEPTARPAFAFRASVGIFLGGVMAAMSVKLLTFGLRPPAWDFLARSCFGSFGTASVVYLLAKWIFLSTEPGRTNPFVGFWRLAIISMILQAVVIFREGAPSFVQWGDGIILCPVAIFGCFLFAYRQFVPERLPRESFRVRDVIWFTKTSAEAESQVIRA